MSKCFLKIILFTTLLPVLGFAQAIPKNYKIVSTAVPFMTISPDSRAAAMGDAGAASSPDASSIYWNSAKMAFLENKFGANISYAPWLSAIVNDMGLVTAQTYYKITENQTFGAGLTYFDQGQIQFTSQTGQLLDNFHSREMTATVGLASKLGANFSAGVNLKFVTSNLVGTTIINGQAGKPGRTAAIDISLYRSKYRAADNTQKLSLDYGLVLQNLGGKVNYGFGQYFIPANLKLGTKIGIHPDNVNQFNILLDFNKLLVPTDASAQASKSVFNTIFSSFYDADGGLSEELAEVMTSLGLEYSYANLLALRAGYFYENPDKGGRQYATAGAGINFKKTYRLDLAYLIPTNSGNPLANTWRLTLNYAIPSNKE